MIMIMMMMMQIKYSSRHNVVVGQIKLAEIVSDCCNDYMDYDYNDMY